MAAASKFTFTDEQNMEISVKYTLSCSVFYAMKDVIFWDETKDRELMSVPIGNASFAMEIMRKYVEQAPGHVVCQAYV